VTLLDNEKVDLDSILVTNVAGTIVYRENVDYTLEEIDSSVRISRTVLGAIANGQTVLVDYRYLRDPAFDDTLFGQTYGIQLHLWKAFRLSYRFFKLDQDIVSGTPPENRIDDTAHTAQLQYDLGWTNTLLSFEDTDRKSGVSLRRWRAQENLRFSPWRPLFFSIKGFYQQTEFKDSNDTEDFYGLRTIINWTPARWSRFELEGFHERISGDREDKLQTGLNASLKMSYRIWNGNISYGYLETEDKNSGQKITEQTLLFEIIRLLW